MKLRRWTRLTSKAVWGGVSKTVEDHFTGERGELATDKTKRVERMRADWIASPVGLEQIDDDLLAEQRDRRERATRAAKGRDTKHVSIVLANSAWQTGELSERNRAAVIGVERVEELAGRARPTVTASPCARKIGANELDRFAFDPARRRATRSKSAKHSGAPQRPRDAVIGLDADFQFNSSQKFL
jgi:hypothetical protein